MQTFVAFQLGINVGKRQVKMAELKQLLESSGYKNVRTLLASGNVVLESHEKNSGQVALRLTHLMTKHFGFEIKNIVKPLSEIKQLVALDPFKKVKITPNTRLNVTFLVGNTRPAFTIPFTSSEKGFTIFSIRDGIIASTVEYSEKTGTGDVMNFIVKQFGKEVTTRNWNTVTKIANL